MSDWRVCVSKFSFSQMNFTSCVFYVNQGSRWLEQMMSSWESSFSSESDTSSSLSKKRHFPLRKWKETYELETDLQEQRRQQVRNMYLQGKNLKEGRWARMTNNSCHGKLYKTTTGVTRQGFVFLLNYDKNESQRWNRNSRVISRLFLPNRVIIMPAKHFHHERLIRIT
jgi:hypothetical protein